jgi:glycosyltransferase involved in cell wall biosynthesis
MRICRVASVPFFLQHHLREQICATANAGHQVTLIAGDGPEMAALKNIPGIEFVLIDIARQISPWRDLRALWRLFVHFRQSSYDIVHSTTPKAGMLCAIAGMMAGVPLRLHTFTGQPWMELHGVKRYVAKAGDWMTAHLNSMSYADSVSQRDFLIEQGVAAKGKIAVIGRGSLAGVDVIRFDRTRWQDQIAGLRMQLGISESAVVISFVGRLTRDKGVSELVEAFSQLIQSGKQCVLLLVGPQEPDRDPLPPETLAKISENPMIIATGYSDEPEKYLAVTDIFCLPSYREGFGNVVIEAAATGVPTVGTDIVGLRDSIVNGETGLLVPPKTTDELAAGLRLLIDDPDQRGKMGERARSRARREFDSRKINADVLAEYERLAQLHLRRARV